MPQCVPHFQDKTMLFQIYHCIPHDPYILPYRHTPRPSRQTDICTPSQHTVYQCRTNQSQIQDFPKEGARFRMKWKCHVDAIQWGGSSRIFPWPRKAYAIQWGGAGGSSRNVSWSQKWYAIQWGGGVVAQIFRNPYSVGGGSSRNFSSSQKKITRFGGGGD